MVAGLAIEAYVHFDLAKAYSRCKTSTLNQGDLFRAEAVASIVAALLLLFHPRRWTAVVAAVVAGAGLAAVLAYAYINIPRIGPTPAMYDAVWYTEKTISVIGEGAAFVAARPGVHAVGTTERTTVGAHGRAATPDATPRGQQVLPALKQATTSVLSRSGMRFSKSKWSVTGFRDWSGKVSTAHAWPGGHP